MKKIIKKILEKIDFYFGKQKLSLFLSILASLKQGKIIFINYDVSKAMWIHRKKNNFVYLVDILPSYSASYNKYFKYVEKTFLKYYSIKEDDVILDVGAGVGTEVVVFKEILSNEGKIYAIEAHPRTYDCLRLLCEENRFNNVVHSNIAISDRKGNIRIENRKNHSANSIILAKESGIEISAITLDDYVELNKINKINFLKINIEGAERQLFNGIKKSWEIIENIAVACHDNLAPIYKDDLFKTKEFIIEILERNNFFIQGEYCDRVDIWVYAKKK